MLCFIHVKVFSNVLFQPPVQRHFAESKSASECSQSEHVSICESVTVPFSVVFRLYQ